MSDATLIKLHYQVAAKLAEIEDLFNDKPEITIVIRTPWLDDGGVLLTSEKNLDDAIAEINRLKDRKPIVEGKP